jgi:hypothetical protein
MPEKESQFLERAREEGAGPIFQAPKLAAMRKVGSWAGPRLTPPWLSDVRQAPGSPAQNEDHKPPRPMEKTEWCHMWDPRQAVNLKLSTPALRHQVAQVGEKCVVTSTGVQRPPKQVARWRHLPTSPSLCQQLVEPTRCGQPCFCSQDGNMQLYGI